MESNVKPIKIINVARLSTFGHVQELTESKRESVLLNYKIDELQENITSLQNENEILSTKLKEKETPIEKIRTYEGINIEDFMNKNPSIAKETMNGGYIIFCTTCRDEDRMGNIPKRFDSCIEIKNEDYRWLSKGKNIKWRIFKKKLIKHLKKHELTPYGLEAQRNLFMAALTVVKMKGAAIHYEQLVSLLKTVGVNIGQYGHCRMSFGNMLTTFQQYINSKLSLYLRTPLPTTGLLPHFAVALVKSTLNRVTNQTTLALINSDCRIAIPVNCSVVNSFDNNDLKEGKTTDLVNQCLDSFLASLNLGQEFLPHITAIYADGQYGELSDNTFKGRIGYMYSDYFISLWDYVHWIDIEVKDVINITFLEAFIKKCNTFHNLLGIGKGREEYTVTTNVLNVKALETNFFSQTRFSSSFVKVLKSLLKTYPTLAMTSTVYRKIQNEYDEIMCLLKGADFPMDLCATLDILSPVSQIMEAAQSITYVPWSFIKALNLILSLLSDMQTNLAKVINDEIYQPSINLFPLLSSRWEELLEKRNESQYFCSWIKTDSSQSNDFSGVWKVRDTKDCLNDYTNLCYQLHGKLKQRFEDNVGRHIVQFGLCFDMNQHLENLADEEKIEICSDKNKKSIDDFNQIYSYLRTLSHLKDHLNVDSWLVFKNWKLCFRDLIFNHSHTFGNWFVDEKRVPFQLDNRIEFIKKEKRENLFIQTYSLILTDHSEIAGVRFSESSMINFLLSDIDYFKSKEYPRELRIVLDFVFSTCGSEACVESFYCMMKSQQKIGGQSHDTLTIRSAIDSTFPIASKCVNTCEDLARLHLYGNNKMQIKSHKEATCTCSNEVCEGINNEDHHDISIILNETDIK